jgi:hypothetical protein
MPNQYDPELRPLADCIAGIDEVLQTASYPQTHPSLRFAVSRCMHIHRGIMDMLDDGVDPSWFVTSGMVDSWPTEAEVGNDGLPRRGEDLYSIASTVIGKSDTDRQDILNSAQAIRPTLAEHAAQDDLAAIVALGFVEALIFVGQVANL